MRVQGGGVVGEDAFPETGVLLPQGFWQLDAQAEVEQNHLVASLGGVLSDEEVAGVGVGVDEAGHEDLLGEHVHYRPCHAGDRESHVLEGILVSHLGPLDPLHDHQSLSDQGLVHPGDVDILPTL